MAKLSYPEIVRELESRGVMPDGPPSLEPMCRALGRLGLSIDPERVVIVAGTNGKGSVSATLEALLSSAGERVGLYTSPHLVETTERIRIADEDISRELFAEAYERVVDLARGIALTHFEMLTLMAAWAFFSREAGAPVDRAIFEVGLGGTWDATNAIPHRHCVITTLGYDHQNLLGSTLAEIAANKFGVVTEGSTVVHSPLPAETLALASEVRERTRSRWREAEPHTARARAGSPPEFRVSTRWGEAALALPGARGAQNTATALTAFEELGRDPRAHLAALARVRWPGRMHRLASGEFPCPVYLSGDHNPQGVASLLELLPHFERARLHVLVGIGKDKDAEGILEPLFALRDARIHLTETPFRGRSVDAYGPWLARARSAERDPFRALERIAAEASASDLILVTGSLYLVGAVMGAFPSA